MQVATLFRESATLLGAASMMESSSSSAAAAATATATASATSSPQASNSSASASPPLQAQSPPQMLQQHHQHQQHQSPMESAATMIPAAVVIDENARMAEMTTKITTSESSAETIVSASLSISSLQPSTPTTNHPTTSMERCSSVEEGDTRSPRSPRSPLSPQWKSPALHHHHHVTERESQEELTQSPSGSSLIGDSREKSPHLDTTSPCLPEDVDMTDINNRDDSPSRERPNESSVNPMDGCDSHNENDSGSAVSKSAAEDNQMVDQRHMLHEESQEHLSSMNPMHNNCLPDENNRQQLLSEENHHLPTTPVPMNLMTGQLMHPHHHPMHHHHHHHHNHHEYSESHHLQHEHQELLHHDQEQSGLHLQQPDPEQRHHMMQQQQHDRQHSHHEQSQQQQQPQQQQQQHPQQQHIQQSHDQDQHHMQQHHYHHHHQFHQQAQAQMHMQQQQQQQQQLHHQQQHQQQQQQQHHHPMTCIDDLMIDDNHDDPGNRYKLLSPSVKHESQDDGYETSAGDVLTPSSHASSHSMTPQHQMHTSVILPKCEIPPPPQSSVDDPYNFIDDELNNSIQMMSPSGGPLAMRQQGYPHHPTGPPSSLGPGGGSGIMGTAGGQLITIGGQMMGPGVSGIQAQGLVDLAGPKKRGRKKKIREENGTMGNGILKPVVHKERKKHDRFNGMPEEEVSKRTLPDHLANNLDIIIIGINPGLFAAYKGHHYAGPGNHFWKCLYLSGLTREQMTAEEDYKLLEFGIGFTNMVERATKGSADLTRKEIKEGSRTLLDKLRKFRPKIAVFNGKLIFEVFSGKKDFNFGRQPECIEGTNTYMWVMPSSSARCAQLPRAADKVPFYAALKKFRDYLNGQIPHIEESECVFSDPKYKQCCEPEPKTENLSYSEITDLSNCNLTNAPGTTGGGQHTVVQNCGGVGENGELLQPGKKKRGRPKKIKGLDGCDDGKMNGRRLTPADSCNSNNNGLNLSTLSNCNGSEMPKKKRGRPKKIKTGDLLNGSTGGMSMMAGSLLNGNSNASSNNGMTNGLEAINNSDLNHNSPNGGMGSMCGSLTQQQQQRLFSPPMHSPSTVGSYCPLGINASTPPMTPSNGSNSNGYHHHPHHQIHHTHQQHHPSYHQQATQQQQQPPSQQYTPHSDLSSEISAAISSEHLGESPTPTSPSLGPPDFDPPGSMQTDDTNPNDLRFSSPASTISEQQQAGHLGNHISGGYPSYRNPGSNNSYMSGSGGSSNDGHGSDGYIQPASNQSQQQQQQQQPPQQQTTNNSGQTLQMSDVASKSLSGLESLVDQIPTMSENDGTSTPNHMASSNPDTRLCDPNDQYGNNCLYTGYPGNMQLSSSSPSATPSSSMLSPHYTNPTSFTSNPNATNCTTSNTTTYGTLSSNFSVSSLTSSNYPASSYHTNLMATSPHHLSGGSGSSPMYMEPHMPVPVNPLYHPYTQHSGYSGYSPVGPPPTIHMPSPNYPYGYGGNTGSYPQPGHHPSHPAASYLSNHPSMFDRIKPDIGYGGF